MRADDAGGDGGEELGESVREHCREGFGDGVMCAWWGEGGGRERGGRFDNGAEGGDVFLAMVG